MIPRIFAGATVFIVAGGPSLIGFDFARLAGRHVIAINRAHEVLPDATLLWWSDILFWLRNRDALLAHRAPWKATAIENRRDGVKYPADVAVYDFTGMTGFDARSGCLRHGNNSSYAAIHLAAQLGAKRIVLLGVDMRHGAAGETHFHTGHGLVRQERTLTEKMLPHFDSLAPALAERGVEIVNASPASALTIWPRCAIDEALA